MNSIFSVKTRRCSTESSAFQSFLFPHPLFLSLKFSAHILPLPLPLYIHHHHLSNIEIWLRMGSLIRPELTLDCSLSSKPSNRAEASTTDDLSDKLFKLNDYFNRLQDEMKKIDAFKRELPLCMLLLNDGSFSPNYNGFSSYFCVFWFWQALMIDFIAAIAAIKDEIMQCKKSNSKPILEEFIPLKVNSSDEKIEVAKEKEIVMSKEKMSWMSSVQLWNSDDQANHLPTDSNKKVIKKWQNYFSSTKGFC